MAAQGITITGRDEQEKRKGVPFGGMLTARNAAILTVIADAIKEKRAFVINSLIAKVALTKDQRVEVDRLLAKQDSKSGAAARSRSGGAPDAARVTS
ncbi:MAG: hypothetical protein ABJA98_21365 [Acidobacteriota bacterium]